jgi:phosphate transport system substrate-binding protein
VAPLEAEWAAAFQRNTGTTVNYQAVGSGTGIKDIAGGLVDFGASDAPLSGSSTVCGGCVQLPWALSATGVGFHVGNLRKLRLTGPVIAKIYLGQITKWNDPQIKSLNKGVALPGLPITVFWRSDGSGDSYAFTDYLSRVSSAFRSRVGTGTLPTFPVGSGAKGNSGLVTALQGTNGSIAYVAVSYLIAHSVPAASIRNAAGNWTLPNLRAIQNAARTVHALPPNHELHIVNPPRSAHAAYPISTFTYVIVPSNAPQGAALKQFILYAIGGGQSFGPALDFAPLPGAVAAADTAALGAIQ